jgi:SAM-dependent methyltransferase
MIAADLTEQALKLARERCRIYGIEAEFSQQNAENITFHAESFSHVNCQGVIHHTPDTQQCIKEIARVLRPGGTASISVYYRNGILRSWPLIRKLGGLLSGMGAALKGRGREHIFAVRDVDEIVRLYDGSENPLGKVYSKDQILKMVTPYFKVTDTYLHFFPARSLPFKVPRKVHRLLDQTLGFMIYLSLEKNEPASVLSA